MDDTAANPDQPCKHTRFVAIVQVDRVGEEDPDSGGMPKSYMANVSVNCAQPPDGCGEAFRFSGVRAGLSFAHPMCDPLETTLRAPIRPASADHDFGMGLPGFSIQVVKP